MASIRTALLSLTAIASLAAGLPAMASSSSQAPTHKTSTHLVASSNTGSSTKPAHSSKSSSTKPSASVSTAPTGSTKSSK